MGSGTVSALHFVLKRQIACLAVVCAGPGQAGSCARGGHGSHQHLKPSPANLLHQASVEGTLPPGDISNSALSYRPATLASVLLRL